MEQHRLRHGVGTLALAAAITLAGLASGIAGGGRVAAQDDASPTPTELIPGTVSVSGHGSVQVTPDTAQVNIGVDVTRPTLDEAQAESNAQASAIIEAVKAAGVADDDVQTSNYSVYVVRNYDEQGNLGEITGYQITNQVNVTIRDVDRVGEILNAAVDAGANNIYGITFYVDDPTAAASEARIMAVEDARQKAEELAAASGHSLGRLIAISEGTTVPPMPPVFQRAGGVGMAADEAAPIEVGTNEVAVDVTMVFELE